MSDASRHPISDDLSDIDESALFDWFRWWHWLMLAGLFLLALVYFPLWRFEQRWRAIQVGDSLERVKERLGNPGAPSYTVQGSGPGGSGAYEVYAFRRYWRYYELVISPDTHQVLSKIPQPGSASPAATTRSRTVSKS